MVADDAWEELFDETTGAPYWHHHVTGETTWDNPRCVRVWGSGETPNHARPPPSLDQGVGEEKLPELEDTRSRASSEFGRQNPMHEPETESGVRRDQARPSKVTP